ncbi:hypothetical protein COCON_G00100740 [Conger conger]|uniref:Uncharacterized protein n=1 Tax=Conger conger TaxID=82655 RepID=A0A9Q1HZ47_CONCO|nr:hypothetical protein COCON_G00100740 [Conger conger]
MMDPKSPSTSCLTTCSAVRGTVTLRGAVFSFRVAVPHDHGPVCTRHHRDVQRPQQSVGEPVPAEDASLVEPVAGRGDLPLHGPALPHPVCGPTPDDLPDPAAFLAPVGDSAEDVSARHPDGRGAEVPGPELHRAGLRPGAGGGAGPQEAGPGGSARAAGACPSGPEGRVLVLCAGLRPPAGVDLQPGL